MSQKSDRIDCRNRKWWHPIYPLNYAINPYVLDSYFSALISIKGCKRKLNPFAIVSPRTLLRILTICPTVRASGSCTNLNNWKLISLKRVEAINMTWTGKRCHDRKWRSSDPMDFKTYPATIGPSAKPSPPIILKPEIYGALCSCCEIRSKRLFMQILIPAQKSPPTIWRVIGITMLSGRANIHAKGRIMTPVGKMSWAPF